MGELIPHVLIPHAEEPYIIWFWLTTRRHQPYLTFKQSFINLTSYVDSCIVVLRLTVTTLWFLENWKNPSRLPPYSSISHIPSPALVQSHSHRVQYDFQKWHLFYGHQCLSLSIFSPATMMSKNFPVYCLCIWWFDLLLLIHRLQLGDISPLKKPSPGST